MSETIEKTTEKPYKFRDLTAEDIAPMAAILQKINIEELKKCFTEEMTEKIVNIFVGKAKDENKEEKNENAQDNKIAAAGIALFPSLLSVAQVIVTNVPKCEKEAFKFLSSVSNLSVEEIRKMKLGAFLRLVVDFVKFVKEEGFSDFF